MLNTKFEAYKVRRELKRSGKDYFFRRQAKNRFGEPSKEFEWKTDSVFVDGILYNISVSDVLYKVRGLYHEQNSNVQLVPGETTQARTKKIPMLLCIYDDVKELKPGDVTVINGKSFVVAGIVNVQEWGIVGDVSLEVFDDGVHD